MGRRIDLSQLVEVADPFFIERWYVDHGASYPVVGFSYRYIDTGKDPIVFMRELREGPTRIDVWDPTLKSLALKDPAEIMDTLREEIYRVEDPVKPDRPHRPKVIIKDPLDPDNPIALKHIRQDHQRLITAWVAWKEAEPEIYAIIRKHLP